MDGVESRRGHHADCVMQRGRGACSLVARRACAEIIIRTENRRASSLSVHT